MLPKTYIKKATLLIHITAIYVHNRISWPTYSKQLSKLILVWVRKF